VRTSQYCDAVSTEDEDDQGAAAIFGNNNVPLLNLKAEAKVLLDRHSLTSPGHSKVPFAVKGLDCET
jgi:hypothetical protein